MHAYTSATLSEAKKKPDEVYKEREREREM
jgi:hypothetical protein